MDSKVKAIFETVKATAVVAGEATASVAREVGKKAGDTVEFGGLLGHAPVIRVNEFGNEAFIARGGRIPAPLHSMRN